MKTNAQKLKKRQLIKTSAGVVAATVVGLTMLETTIAATHKSNGLANSKQFLNNNKVVHHQPIFLASMRWTPCDARPKVVV